MLTILTLRRLSPLLLGLTLVNGQAQNLVVPDAGALRQQVEQKRDFAPPSTAQPPKAGSAEPARAPTTGTTLVVKAFQFEGHHLMSTEALNASVSGFVGRSLGFEELQTVRDAVEQAYRDAGWLAQVNLPRQDVTSGIVTFKVVEATLAGVRFEGEPPQRVSKQMIEALFAQHIKDGEAARLDLIDRALLLSDDLPGVSVAGALEAGQRDGETALLLKSSDEPAYYGDVAIDNTGSRWTGSQRLSANLFVNSPTGQGDLLSLALMHTEGINYARLAHTFPAGYSGLRLGANFSRVNYRVVDGPMSQSATPIKGNSDSLGLEATYPWLRGRRINVYVSSALDVKSFRNEDVQVQSDYLSQALRLGVSGNLFDSLGGGGANSASLQLLNGRLGRMQMHTQINSLPRTYQKINYGLTRQQALSADQSLLLSLSGQHANEALDSSERFYIGGPGNVRAYPSSEASGERGHAASAEWRWRLDPNWLLSLFVDRAKVHSLPAGSGGGSVTLEGYGLSMAWTGPMGINTRLTWARRVGNNPKPTPSGSDSDGTLRRDRFWLSASLPF